MKRIDENKLKEAVKNSYTISDALEKMGLPKYSSGNHRSFKIWRDKYNLDTSHFLGRSYIKNRKGRTSKIYLSHILVKNSHYHRTNLKKKLLSQNLLKYECYICGLTEWMGRKISLQLDHINGVNNDNRIENLRILCPNCHAQTDTYSGKNSSDKERIEKTCPCGKKIDRKAKECSKCYHKRTKGVERIKYRKVKNRPSKEQLLKEIGQSSYVSVGKKYGVSDNAIRKWLK